MAGGGCCGSGGKRFDQDRQILIRWLQTHVSVQATADGGERQRSHRCAMDSS
jgi:hypothetical protein